MIMVLLKEELALLRDIASSSPRINARDSRATVLQHYGLIRSTENGFERTDRGNRVALITKGIKLGASWFVRITD